MRVLVCGGCGFIGSYVVDQLLVRGHTIRVFDRQAERFRPPLIGVEYQYGDFRDQTAILEALVGVDAVVHLVSTTFPGTADLNPLADVQDNLIGTLALLDNMVKSGVSRLLFLSSGGTVYGIPDEVPIREDHPLRPINSYGIVKASIEYYLEVYRKTRNVSTIAIRASNPYGPRQGHDGVQGVISTFLRRALADEHPEIWGDGAIVRDYLHVRDLANLCAIAVSSDKVGSYNAGFGKGTSLNQIIDILRDITGKEITPLFKPARKVDIPTSVLDVSRAREDFGWECRIPLRKGIEETWLWLSNSNRSATSSR